MEHFAKEERNETSEWLNTRTKTSKRSALAFSFLAIIILFFAVRWYLDYRVSSSFQHVTTLAKRIKLEAILEYSINGAYSGQGIDLMIPDRIKPYVTEVRTLPTPNSQSIKVQLVLSKKMFGQTKNKRNYTYTLVGLGTSDGGQVWSIDKSDGATLCPTEELCSEDKLHLNTYFQTISSI
jgi:hypothetical protein